MSDMERWLGVIIKSTNCVSSLVIRHSCTDCIAYHELTLRHTPFLCKAKHLPDMKPKLFFLTAVIFILSACDSNSGNSNTEINEGNNSEESQSVQQDEKTESSGSMQQLSKPQSSGFWERLEMKSIRDNRGVETAQMPIPSTWKMHSGVLPLWLAARCCSCFSIPNSRSNILFAFLCVLGGYIFRIRMKEVALF